MKFRLIQMADGYYEVQEYNIISPKIGIPFVCWETLRRFHKDQYGEALRCYERKVEGERARIKSITIEKILKEDEI